VRLLLARHGETVWNAERRFQGWTDVALSERGRAQAEALGRALRGYHVAALSYDSPEILAAFTLKRHLTYTLLSDPKSEIIDRYNLRDPQYPPGSRAYGVPRPIIFVLDPQAVIKAKLYEESFKNRPPVTAVISKLDELAGRS